MVKCPLHLKHNSFAFFGEQTGTTRQHRAQGTRHGLRMKGIYGKKNAAGKTGGKLTGRHYKERIRIRQMKALGGKALIAKDCNAVKPNKSLTQHKNNRQIDRNRDFSVKKWFGPLKGAVQAGPAGALPGQDLKKAAADCR
jgi:hypothetical protein